MEMIKSAHALILAFLISVRQILPAFVFEPCLELERLDRFYRHALISPF